MIIRNFDNKDLNQIVDLVINNYQQARKNLPILSDKYESKEQIIDMFKNVNKDTFFVAYEGDEVIGFIAAYYIDELKGTAKGALSMPFMHGVKEGVERHLIYNKLYRAASSKWVKNACYTHCMVVYRNEIDVLDNWFHNEFGLFVIDAVRNLETISVPDINDHLLIRKATEEDIPDMINLFEGIKDHLKASPIFLYDDENINPVKKYMEWIKTETNVLWIAKREEQIIGYIKTNTTEINMDEQNDGKTMAINGAYVIPEFRGQHIMLRLLNKALVWAQEEGLKRCSVDFETTNFEGKRFWLKHFTPYSYALKRRIDERNHLRIVK